MFRICILLILTLCTQASRKEAIYGEFDVRKLDRQDFLKLRQQSRSVTVVTNKHSLSSFFDGELFQKKSSLLSNNSKICKDANPWENSELRLGHCSAFLVAPNKVLTAGHCILDRQWDCDQKVFIFDAKEEFITKSNSQFFIKSQVYSCKKIIKHFNHGEDGLDLALIELDRDVNGRRPIALNTNTRDYYDLYMIGHPLGIAQKLSPNGLVREVTDLNIIAEIDSFSGNSGSPVFSTQDNGLVGMLVSGEEDFVWNIKDNCYDYVYCRNGSCSGEKVLRADVLYQLLKNDL